MIYESLGEYIKRRAADRGMSGRSLSEALGLSSSYINAITNNQFIPSTEKCRQIAAFFNDDPNVILQLAGYYTPPPLEDPTVRAILQDVASLSPQGRRYVGSYAAYLHTQETKETKSSAVREQPTVYLACNFNGRAIEMQVPAAAAELSDDEIAQNIVAALNEAVGTITPS